MFEGCRVALTVEKAHIACAQDPFPRTTRHMSRAAINGDACTKNLDIEDLWDDSRV